MKKLSLVLAAGLVLAACGNTEEKEAKKETKTEATTTSPVKVILTAPKQIDAGKETTLTAEVTQGKEKVNDADEVMFEIIKDNNKKTSDKKTVKESKDGIYSLPYTFKEDGAYKVISHVTARGQHTMPSKEVLVGHAAADKKEADKEEHHHEGGIHIMPIKAEKDKAADLMIHVQDAHEQPATGVTSRLEIKDPNGDTTWVDLKETSKGQYEGQSTFKEPGTYNVTAHAEGDHGFHVHEDTTFEVK